MNKPFVWDALVRLTHWIVAALFLANYFILPKGSEPHQWAGYIVIVAVIIRLIWGVITHSPARLSRFKPSPRKAIEHLKEVKATHQDHHLGHNPAGAIMIWLMWALLLATGITGWGTEWSVFHHAHWLKETHETLASITMTAVAIHVAALIVMSKVTHRSYIRSMWIQKKSTQ
ncbi:cytochrome B [Vibrio sp. CAIM 722]|uniref:Cytochrome B n=1 Tax=Vibrio eleionomae TaxID=2653505 RepID=A0A7X4LJC9_9VIBR|nr:cytochrome b/b6 domain-containing protein [Vibrio eleionomae]MZI93078.1 cytochrome B [Vibrio eleionomae]